MGQTVNAAVRVKVLERCRFRCERCGLRLPSGLHMSHRQPRGMGGQKGRPHDRLSNINALCPKCHLGFVEREPAEAERLGFRVRRGGSTRNTPFLAWFGWTSIDDAGAYDTVPDPVSS